MSDAGALPEDLERVRDVLISWYDTSKRSFPWRETTDPYPILVSEVMSHQTQLERVVEPWHDFLDRWPTVESLAAADRADVVRFWTDHRLGYNTRARYLHEAATRIMDAYDGEFPESPAELATLPGVGPYTANAVASFAFNAGGAVVDTNVKRVLYRAFDVSDSDTAFETAASTLMPEGRSRRWNNALMELGGTACRPTPRCDEEACPWRPWCRAYATGDFTAPDVPSQPNFEGSRREMRGRVIAVLADDDELPLAELGPRIRADYTPDGEHGRGWLAELLSDLESDGLVDLDDRDGTLVANLRR